MISSSYSRLIGPCLSNRSGQASRFHLKLQLKRSASNNRSNLVVFGWSLCVCVFFLMLGALFVCISSFPHESDQQSMWPFPGEQGSQAVALRRPGDACLDAGSATLENKWNIVSLQMDNLTVSMSVLVRQTTSFLCWFFPKNSSSMFPHPH